MIFFISYDCKVFPINIYFLDIIGVCLKHFFLTWNESQTKCTKKGRKNSFILQILKKLDFIVSFPCYLIISQVKDFLIINNLSQILHVFVLLYKDKLKVQHESATCLLCTNMLYFYVALFLGRS